MNGAQAPAPMRRLKRSRSPLLAAFDGGGAMLQQRSRDVLLGAALLLFPVVALNVWVTAVAFERLDARDTSRFGNSTGAGIEDVAVWSAAVLASVAAAVVGHFVALLLLGDRFGQPISMGRALARTGRRLPRVVAAWAVTHWWFPLVALILVTASIDAVIGWSFLFIPLGWVAATFTLLVVPAMVGENLGAFEAAKRGWRLARLRFGLCGGFMVVSTLLSTMLIAGMATLIPLLVEFGFVELGGAQPIVQSLMGQLAVLVVVPLMGLATAQLYIEVRLEGEGLDLVMEADAAFGPRSTVSRV